MNTREQGAYYYKGHPTMDPYNPNDIGGGGGQKLVSGDVAYTAVRALEATTGDRKWEFKMVGDSWTGTLATAGGLVFCADSQGNFFALDADDGKPLWNIQLGNARARESDHVRGGRQTVCGRRGRQLHFGLQPAVSGYFAVFLCESLRTSSTSRRESKLETVRVAEVMSSCSACTS